MARDRTLEYLLVIIFELFIWAIKTLIQLIVYLYELFTEIADSKSHRSKTDEEHIDISIEMFSDKASNSIQKNNDCYNSTLPVTINPSLLPEVNNKPISKKIQAILDHSTIDLGVKWRFDSVTDFQMTLMEKLMDKHMFQILPKELTKGQASDVIGLFYDPEEETSDFVRFSGLHEVIGQNQTEYRWKAYQLAQDSAFVSAFNETQYPATPKQKDEIRFLGGSASHWLNYPNATNLIEQLRNEHPEKAYEYAQLNQLYLSIGDMSERYEFNRELFTWHKFKKTLEAAKSKGLSICDIEKDPHQFIEYLRIIFPRISN